MLKNIFFIFLCFLVFGCTSTPPRSDFYKGNYQSALNKMQKIVDETPTGKDYAYHRIFLGSIAFTMGKYKMAQSVFKDALKVMESYGENPNQEIKAIIGSEAGKTYKGDPYEKMMVHYYIGMTYYFMKQYEKALAGFTNALSVDAMSPKPEYKKDCALLYFMAAKALLKSGEKEKALGFIKQSDRVSHTKNISKISLSDIENSNIIFIIETGKGPQKRRRGAGQSIEVLMPGECPEHIVRIFSNGKHIGNAKLVADIFFQSTTAGRSKFSGVREKKGLQKILLLVFLLSNLKLIYDVGHFYQEKYLSSHQSYHKESKKLHLNFLTNKALNYQSMKRL